MDPEYIPENLTNIEKHAHALFNSKPNKTRSLIQHYIHLIGFTYQLKEDDRVQDISDELLLRIAKSETSEITGNITTIQHFLKSYFSKAFEYDNLDDVIIYSLSFLNGFINHPAIPASTPAKVVCCVLLAFHMNIVGYYLSLLNHGQDALEESMNYETVETLEISIDLILQNVTTGLAYKKYSEMIAKEFFDALDNYNIYFVNTKVNFLTKLKDFLCYDNVSVQRFALSSISKLRFSRVFCMREMKAVMFQGKQNLVTIVVNKFLSDRFDKSHLLMIDAINFLMKAKNLRGNPELIDPEQRIGIYAKLIVIKSAQLHKKLLEMMLAFEVDITTTCIKVFALIDASPEIIQLSVGSSLSALLIRSKILDVIIENYSKNQRIAEIAANVFKNTKKTVPNVMDVPKLMNALRLSKGNDEVFSSLLESFLKVNNEAMKIFTPSKIPLISILLVAIEQFSNYKTLLLVTKVIKKIATVFPQDIIAPLKEAFDLVYSEFLSAETSLILESEVLLSHHDSLVKITLLLGSNICDFLNYFYTETLIIITTNHLENVNDPLFPFFGALHLILLQYMWSHHVGHLLNNEDLPDLPYDFKFVVDSLQNLIQKMLTILHRRDYSILQAEIGFSTLLTALIKFSIRPTKVENKDSLLIVSQPKVTIPMFRGIVNFVVHYLHQSEISKNDGKVEKVMLLQLVDLIKINSTVVDVSCLFKIVRMYKAWSPFRNEIETLLKNMIEICKTSDRAIGLAIVHFSKYKCDGLDYMEFMNALDNFFNLTFNNEDIDSLKSKVGAFVVKQLPTIINQLPKIKNSRLTTILPHLTMFLKQLDRSSLKKITALVTDNFDGLTREEIRELKKFKSTLSK